MTREERLEFCQVCTNRKMDWNKGLLCGLTGEAAAFEGSCDSFDEDEQEAEYVQQRQIAVNESQIGDPEDFRKNKRRGAFIFWGGLLFAVIGFIGAQVDGGGYVILPLGAVIYGGLMYLRGREQEKQFKQQQNKEE